MTKATAYCDGRGNCQDGSCAVVVEIDGKIYEKSRLLGGVSNNVAEYEGLILALEFASYLGVTELEVFSDSQLIVHQTRGDWKIREKSLLPLRDLAWEIASVFEKISISWVRREKNTHADRLCREAVKVPRRPVKDRIRSRRSA